MDRSSLALALAALAVAACNKPAPLVARPFAAIVAEQLPTIDVQPEKRPESQRRMKEAPVYLDGKPIGVLKHSELPPSLKPHPHKLLDGRETPRYRLAEALVAMGANLDKITMVHLYGGGNRIVVLPGDELRKHKDDLEFSFTQATKGKPRLHLPPVKMNVNTSIDGIATIAVYAEKKAPNYDKRTHNVSFGDGVPIEGIPYTPKEDTVKGTRVYVDGALVGGLKRKQLPNKVLADDSTAASPRFSLDKWLADEGVDTQQPFAIEILNGEQVIDRLDARAYAEEKPRLEFAMQRRNQGKMLLFLPKEDDAVKAAHLEDDARGVRVSAIEIYRKVPVSTRPLTSLSEVVESADHGSSDAQGEQGQNRGNGDSNGSAQGSLGDDAE